MCNGTLSDRAYVLKDVNSMCYERIWKEFFREKKRWNCVCWSKKKYFGRKKCLSEQITVNQNELNVSLNIFWHCM